VLLAILTVALAPVGSVAVCGLIANTHGCKVDEGSVHPCIIGGHDYGQLLYTLGVLGWLMLVTLPGGAACVRGLAHCPHRPSGKLAKTTLCELTLPRPSST
jgi:hypothetical protein